MKPVKMKLAQTYTEKKRWQHCWTSTTLQWSPQAPGEKEEDRKHLRKWSGERYVEAGFKHCWRKIETAAQDRAGGREVACGRLCSTASDNA